MSRLDFAPGVKEIRLTDAGRSLFAFTPKDAAPVSFDALGDTVERAGYALLSAEVVVEGTLAREGDRWSVVADQSGQRFALAGKRLAAALGRAEPGARVEVTGDWKAAGRAPGRHEVVSVREVKRLEARPAPASPGGRS